MKGDVCPYCKLHPVVKKTCGTLLCMHKHKIAITRKWREKYGYIYRPTGKHKQTQVL